MDKTIDKAWRTALAAAMREARLTQGDVAAKTGGVIKRYKVGRILNGRYTTKIAEAVIIAAAVGLDLSEFVSTSTAIMNEAL